ncbi:MAG: alpha-ribazole phosphatase [Cyanobacteriota bacterium]
MEIFLIRHTSVDINKEICYGFSDVKLADNYKEDFKKLKKKLKPINPSIVYSSPLIRCSMLADYLSDTNYIKDNRLKELNFGDWEMKNWYEIEQDELDKWIKEFVNYRCPEGETFVELFERAKEFYQEIITKDFEKVYIITHGGVIRSIVALILEIPLKNAPSIQIDFGSISKISINKEVVNLSYLNK